MSERVRFIDHKGKKILFTDSSGLKDIEQLKQNLIRTKEILLKEDQSVLFMTDIKGATFNSALVSEMKEVIKEVTPKIKASAYVGVEGIQKVILIGLAKIKKRKLKVFDSVEEAKDWLIIQ